VTVAAKSRVDQLFEQCRDHRPETAVMADGDAARQLRARCRAANLSIEVLTGIEGLMDAVTAPQIDVVVAAIVGAAGLESTLAAVRAGKRILLANKESLVMSGRILIDAARASGAELLPVDSEHNAIFQCMPIGFRAGEAPHGVRRILLTCSGGPFRNTPLSALKAVTPDQACAHPNWVMGRKISVDSATLMNKGLELIEACIFFGVAPTQVEVVVHPQSVVHSMVEFEDGSVLAQLGNPDMRTPIAHALAWPDRIDSGVASLDIFSVARLDFERPDLTRFPCLRLAYEAARAGGTAPTILNAANEVAAQAFLDRQIGFPDIARVCEYTIARLASHSEAQLEVVIADDSAARTVANRYVQELGRSVKQGVS
jgi:1-deoxy-D-xylulose-5-phosphate reductoisomerase